MFLRFICEYEISGRGNQLHEYLIGTGVLGQEPGYSTAENSVVRSRAYSLRRKLQDFYASEAPGTDVRIGVPKGSYCPRFVKAGPAPGNPRTAVRASGQSVAHDSCLISVLPVVAFSSVSCGRVLGFGLCRVALHTP